MMTTDRFAQRRPIADRHRSARGMSLVELMIGLVLSIMVLGMVIKIFSNTRQQFQSQEQLARIHENARQAFQMLNDDIHMAGFMGPMQQYWAVRESTNNQRNLPDVAGECFTPPAEQFRWVAPMITLPRAAPALDVIPPKLFGRNDSNSRFTGCIPDAQYYAGPGGDGTDVLSVHYAGAPWNNGGAIESGRIPSAALNSNGDMFYLRSGLAGGLVYTCGMGMGGGAMALNANACLASAFSGMGDDVYNALAGTGMASSPLYVAGAPTEPTSDVVNYGIQAATYYVRPCTNAGADGVCGGAGDDETPALVRARMEYVAAALCGAGGVPCVVHEPVAEGVVGFEIQYGIDSPGVGTPALADCTYDGYVDRYVTADQIGGGNISTDAAMAAWSHVLTARIWLLLRATQLEAGYVDANSPYDMGGKNVNAVDGYRHQLFTTTVMLRNFSPQSC